MLNHAQWVAFDPAYRSAEARKSFVLEAFDKVTVEVCGLGFFELWCNGVRVDGHYFKPVWTDYERRDLSSLAYPLDEEMTHRVSVLRYDLTALCREGENLLEFLVGNGWYRQTRRNVEGKLAYGGALTLCFEVEIRTDGLLTRVVSDESLECREGKVADNPYFGEEWDFGREDEWTYPELRLPPEAELVLQACPCDTAARTLRPALIKVCPDRRIYDATEHVSGWVEGIAGGGDVEIRYADELAGDGTLDFFSSGGETQIQSHVYRRPTPGQALSPLFTWCGFRYFEVRGELSALCVKVVHADVAPCAEFVSGHSVPDWLFAAFCRTLTNNMHAGVLSDCPHRERLGYTGDGQVSAAAALACFDAKTFYEKWLQDIADSQDLATGHVQHTAPFYGGGGGPGGWGGAIMILPYRLYERYGDLGPFLRHRESIRRWLSCMEGLSEDGLIVRERAGGWCLGDWCAPLPLQIPAELVNTYYFVKAMEQFAELSARCAVPCDLSAPIAAGKSALRKCYDRCGPVQGADAFLVDLGFEDLYPALRERYRQNCRFDTGIFGTDVLLKVLTERGDRRLVWDLLCSEEYASFGYQKNRGADTLWENWNGESSRCHHMFGSAVRYLFTAGMGVTVSHEEQTITVRPLPFRAARCRVGALCVRVRDGRAEADYDGPYRLRLLQPEGELL